MRAASTGLDSPTKSEAKPRHLADWKWNCRRLRSDEVENTGPQARLPVLLGYAESVRDCGICALTCGCGCSARVQPAAACVAGGFRRRDRAFPDESEERFRPDTSSESCAQVSDTSRRIQTCIDTICFGRICESFEVFACRKRGISVFCRQAAKWRNPGPGCGHARSGGTCGRPCADYQARFSRPHDYCGREWWRAREKTVFGPSVDWPWRWVTDPDEHGDAGESGTAGFAARNGEHDFFGV